MRIKIIASISLILTLTFWINQTATADSLFSVTPSGALMEGAATYDDRFTQMQVSRFPIPYNQVFVIGVTLPLTYTTVDRDQTLSL
jgi:hypothetical protein